MRYFSRYELLLGIPLGIGVGLLVYWQVKTRIIDYPSIPGLINAPTTSCAIGDPALLMTVPKAMELSSSPYDTPKSNGIAAMHSAQFVHRDGFSLFASMVRYNAGLEPRMESAAQGALQEMLTQQSGSLNYEEGPCDFGMYRGYCLSGTFMRQGKEYVFEHKILTYKNYLWQINLVYKANDLAEKALANQILESVDVVLH